MKTIGTSVTLSFFTISMLSILLYSACSSENRKVPPSGPLRFKDPGPTTNNAPSNPIIITTYAQLKDVKNGLSKHYRLGRDIDASPSWSENDTSATCVAYNGSNGKAANGNPAATCTGFTPIGAFGGSFDGRRP